MFAHISSLRQRSHYHSKQTYISLAIGAALSCLALSSAQAATDNPNNSSKRAPFLINVDEADIETAPVVYERLSNPDMPIDETNAVSKAFVAQQARLFFDCTQVQTDAARLACFDKVAEQGKTPSYTTSKQPLDLAKTFYSTISGNPQVVLAENVTAINSGAVEDTDEGTDIVLLTNQPQMKSNLDTRRVDKDDVQILEEIGVTQEEIEKFTPLSLAYDLDKNSERGTWTVRPYRPTYVLPLFYTFDPNLNPSSPTQDKETDPNTSNDIRNTELKFQLSLKTKVAEDLFGTSADMWFGYTQESHWQVYNEDNSRPFRATDYQPEIFLTQPVKANLPFGGRLRMLGIGAIHHSNGKADPLSRSWNRAYLMAGAEWGKLSVIPRLWARVNNESSSSEDNPDIEDYMGYGDVKFLYDLPDQQSLSGTLRYNPSTNKGAAQIDYVYPLSKNVNGFVQLFQGYGESIIDYNHENTSIGFGIVLNDWKGF